MQRTEKEAQVEAFREDVSQAEAVVLAEFHGLTVPEATELRQRLRRSQVAYKVFKNTLAKRAIAGTEMEAIADSLVGPTAWIYSSVDPILPAKLVSDYLAETSTDHLRVKRGYLQGKALSPQEVIALAKLPGQRELRAQLLGLLTAVPAKLLRVLQARPVEFLRVLEARRQELEEP
ncbi:MAG: 50S ribosomal protein L10 [Bradymonadales bacterium]|nr:50S ribosomal protein L10 [Bradymonadales bacterium]